MSDLTTYDTSNVKPSESFDPLPPGKYKAMIVASEIKDTQAGDGKYLKLEFQILEGEFANRRLWTNLNLRNPNQKAMEIAYRDLAAIESALGLRNVQRSEDLHDRPLIVKVKIEKGKDGYDDQNRINGYFAIDNSAPAPAPVQPNPQPVQQQPAPTSPVADTTGKPPWAQS